MFPPLLVVACLSVEPRPHRRQQLGAELWDNDASESAGGSCTNFVSQAIIGGLHGSSSASTTYRVRESDDVDRSSSGYPW